MLQFDIIIKNARIVDGTGNPSFKSDIGIKNGKISYIGKIDNEVGNNEIIDASNQVISPGFIDCHTHSDFVLLKDPTSLSKLKQGVTTQMIGACGISAAPVVKDKVQLLNNYTGFVRAGISPEYNWETFGDYLNELDKLPLGTNVGAFVGHGTIRLNAMGFDTRKPTEDEIYNMKSQLRNAMEDGAFGLTSGLIYAPGVYSEPEEIVELAKELKNYKGIYLSHLRNESHDLLESVKEIIHVAQTAKVPVQLHHHKVMGIKNWGLVNETLNLIEEYRNNGLDITIDQYPYTAASTTLRACLPPWVHEGGIEKVVDRLKDTKTRKQIMHEIEHTDNWDNFYKNSNGASGILISYTPLTPEYEGKTLESIAKLTSKEPLDILCDIIAINKGKDNACYYMMCEDDVNLVMKYKYAMIGSDSIPVAQGAKCHPRTNGTFPRVISKYVRENKVISLEESIYKMSGFPANRFYLKNKGLIKEGYDADLVIFNLETISDGATYEDPFIEPTGINYVIVNGQIVLKNNEIVNKMQGKVLRNQ